MTPALDQQTKCYHKIQNITILSSSVKEMWGAEQGFFGVICGMLINLLRIFVTKVGCYTSNL